MNRLFEIQTLSDRNYRRLADPITIITGIATLLPSIFPNLLGSERLEMQHLDKLFPGSGFYTSSYKAHLKQKIKYLKDLQSNLRWYTGEFILQNLSIFCPSWTQGQNGEICWEGFYRILKTESMGGGIQPPPGFNYQTLLLVGGGLVLLLALTKKKGKSKK